MKSLFRRTTLLALALGVCLAAPASPLAAADGDLATMVPGNAFLMIEFGPVEKVIANYKKTHGYGLWEDPAMQPFLEPAKQRVDELISEGLADLWGEMGLENPPKDLPWPDGKAVLAVRLAKVMKEFRRPTFGPDGKIEGWETHQYPATEPVFLAAVDFGEEKFPKAKELIEKMIAGAADKKDMQKSTHRVRGVEVTELSPKRADDAPVPANERAAIAFLGTAVLVGQPAMVTDALVVRYDASDLKQFVKNPACRRTLGALGGADSDLSMYLDITRLMSEARMAAGQQGGEEDLAEFDRAVKQMGVDNLQGLGLTFQIAPGSGREAHVRGLLAAEGGLKGLPKALAPINGPTGKPNPLLTAGLTGFVVARYDIGSSYDQVMDIMSQVTGQQLRQNVEMAMQMLTGGQGENAPPPVDLRKDVLGQLVQPLTFGMRHNKPYGDPNSAEGLFAIGVRDAAQIKGALGRLIGAAAGMSGANPDDIQMQFLGETIYKLPLNPMMIVGMAGPMGGGGGGEELALAVAGENLLVGRAAVVQQQIRAQQKGAERKSISTDPMYQHAAKALPAQAGAFFYQNERINGAVAWKMIRKAARDAEGEPGPMGPGMNPMEMMMRMVKEKLGPKVDFSKLPAYEKIAHYYGASVGFVRTSPRGLEFEVVTLQPPKK